MAEKRMSPEGVRSCMHSSSRNKCFIYTICIIYFLLNMLTINYLQNTLHNQTLFPLLMNDERCRQKTSNYVTEIVVLHNRSNIVAYQNASVLKPSDQYRDISENIYYCNPKHLSVSIHSCVCRNRYPNFSIRFTLCFFEPHIV